MFCIFSALVSSLLFLSFSFFFFGGGGGWGGWEGLTNLQIKKLFCPRFPRNRLTFDKVFCISVSETGGISPRSKISSVHRIRHRHGLLFTTLRRVGKN